MGLFSKISGGNSSKSGAIPSARQQSAKRKTTEPNVLHNPNAYLAYAGDGIDRGAMMAQQAATRTHQQALDAQQQRQVKESQIPKPRSTLPLSQTENHQIDNAKEGSNIGDRINFSAFNKQTRIYLSQSQNPEWFHAFEAFGFTANIMRFVKIQWEGGLKEGKEMLISAYKKESKISQNAWNAENERNAVTTGHFVTRLCKYNGVTVAVYGGFDRDAGEPYFDFVLPTNKHEFISWRKKMMEDYNSKRAARGFELINMEGTHDYAAALPHEVPIYQK